jgi:hypothetical protein
MAQAENDTTTISQIAAALTAGDTHAALIALGLAPDAQGAVQACSGEMIPVSARDESQTSVKRLEPTPHVADSAERAALSRRSLMNMIVTGATAAAATPLASSSVAAAGQVHNDVTKALADMRECDAAIAALIRAYDDDVEERDDFCRVRGSQIPGDRRLDRCRLMLVRRCTGEG